MAPAVLREVWTALERLGETCLVSLTPADIRFALTEEHTSGEQAFADIPVPAVFDAYRIESKHGNEIHLMTRLTSLLKALRSAEASSRITLKLTKKRERPCLTFEIASDSLSVIQDVPVTIVDHDRLGELLEPELPDPKVKVRMPPLKSLRALVDRLRSVDDRDILRITATSTGEMVLQIENEMVNIKTFYKGLALDKKDSNQSQGGSGAEESKAAVVSATCSVSTKKLQNVLAAHALRSDFVVGCIIEHHAFVLFLKLGESGKGGAASLGNITYYIPLCITDGDAGAEAEAEAEGQVEVDQEGEEEGVGAGSMGLGGESQ